MSVLAKEENIKYTGKKEMRNFELDNQRQLDVMSWVNTIFLKKHKNINIISTIIEYVQFLVKSRTKDNW